MSVTPADVARAIAIIRDHRANHLDYARWQESTPNWQSQIVAEENVGGPKHHRDCAAKYDHVLKVLRSLEDSL